MTASFDDFQRGDRIRFVTQPKFQVGRQELVWREGVVLLVTPQALTVWCDPNPIGRRALLRRTEWARRRPQKL